MTAEQKSPSAIDMGAGLAGALPITTGARLCPKVYQIPVIEAAVLLELIPVIAREYNDERPTAAPIAGGGKQTFEFGVHVSNLRVVEIDEAAEFGTVQRISFMGVDES